MPGLRVVLTLLGDADAPDAGPTLEELAARVGALEAEVAHARQQQPPPPEPVSEHLDVREPPFSAHDWTWLNGSNYQPASLLRLGPVTPTFFVDVDYAWQFW